MRQSKRKLERQYRSRLLEFAIQVVRDVVHEETDLRTAIERAHQSIGLLKVEVVESGLWDRPNQTAALPSAYRDRRSSPAG